MADSYKKMIDSIPKIYRPEYNRVMKALILALATADDEITTQIGNAKDQLFVRTATGQDLDRLANSLGVSRPQSIGLSDTKFQELIPNLSLKPKQIKKAFYDTADIFWGPLFSRANVSSLNTGPFDVSVGDEIKVKVDNGEIQTIKAVTGEIATDGAATAEEIAAILNKTDGATAEVIEDSVSGDKAVNLRTDTPGSVGSLEILSSSMISTLKLNFPLGLIDILDLDQRVSIYNLDPNTLIIELPSIVPTLRRTLRGSHHIHADGTLEPPKGAAQGIWAGSFLYNPSGSGGNFTLTRQKVTLQQNLNAGEVYTSIEVDDSSIIENPTGNLIFDFGKDNEEVPVGYRGVPNDNTLLIDPGYTFEKDHSIGESINVISSLEAYEPRTNGQDLAIYLTSPSGAREVVQEILESLKAAGIIINFVILAPDYLYILDNPYLSTDDAPSID